jgi:hypothetical protein
MIVQYVDKNGVFLSMKKIRIFFISFKAIYYVLDPNNNTSNYFNLFFMFICFFDVKFKKRFP